MSRGGAGRPAQKSPEALHRQREDLEQLRRQNVCDDCGVLPIVFLGVRGGRRRGGKPVRLCPHCVDRPVPADANARVDRQIEVQRIVRAEMRARSR
jgi:hypothetical protein